MQPTLVKRKSGNAHRTDSVNCQAEGKKRGRGGGVPKFFYEGNENSLGKKTKKCEFAYAGPYADKLSEIAPKSQLTL